MIFLIGVNGMIWLKQYWRMSGRIHFTAITIASIVFMFFAFRLNLIVLLYPIYALSKGSPVRPLFGFGQPSVKDIIHKRK